MKISKRERKFGKDKRKNPVAKNINKFNKPSTMRDRTKYNKKDKYNNKALLGDEYDV